MLRLLSYLGARRHGAALRDLAAELGVSDRQVRRDLEALYEAGHRWERTRHDGRAWIRLLDPRPEALALTLRERCALVAMREAMLAWDGNPFAADVRSACDKVASLLPADQQAHLAQLDRQLAWVPEPGAKRYAESDDHLDALLTGLLRRSRVRCAYRSRRGRIRRGELEPWSLVFHRQALYVVGLLHDGTSARAELRTFAVERFLEAEYLRGRRFEVPAAFDVRLRFDTAFGITVAGEPRHIVVDFAPCVADLVLARRWHPSQRLVPLPDGGVRLSMQVGSAAELVPWLLTWGPWAEVREPDDVAARVQSEHRAAARG